MVVAVVAAGVVVLGGCSKQSGPAQGSPEWLWAAAHESYNAGDMEKTMDHLTKIESRGNNPYVERARAWRMVLDAGATGAQLDLAQAYTDGMVQARTQKAQFLRMKTDHLKEARRHAIHLVEAYDSFVKEAPPANVTLEFPFPRGSAAPVGELDKVYRGLPIPDEQRALASEKMIERGTIRAVSSVLTTTDDAAGAQKVLTAGKADVPTARFLAAMASALNRSATVFDRKNLDDSEKMKLVQERALDACKRAMAMKPDATLEKDLKKLQADLEKAIKPAGSKAGRKA